MVISLPFVLVMQILLAAQCTTVNATTGQPGPASGQQVKTQKSEGEICGQGDTCTEPFSCRHELSLVLNYFGTESSDDCASHDTEKSDHPCKCLGHISCGRGKQAPNCGKCSTEAAGCGGDCEFNSDIGKCTVGSPSIVPITIAGSIIAFFALLWCFLLVDYLRRSMKKKNVPDVARAPLPLPPAPEYVTREQRATRNGSWSSDDDTATLLSVSDSTPIPTQGSFSERLDRYRPPKRRTNGTSLPGPASPCRKRLLADYSPPRSRDEHKRKRVPGEVPGKENRPGGRPTSAGQPKRRKLPKVPNSPGATHHKKATHETDGRARLPRLKKKRPQ